MSEQEFSIYDPSTGKKSRNKEVGLGQTEKLPHSKEKVNRIHTTQGCEKVFAITHWIRA